MSPTPEEIKAARKAVGMSQSEAARTIGTERYQTWQAYELGTRKMPAAKWELFRLKTENKR